MPAFVRERSVIGGSGADVYPRMRARSLERRGRSVVASRMRNRACELALTAADAPLGVDEDRLHGTPPRENPVYSSPVSVATINLPKQHHAPSGPR
ncbi:MAG: hypothetical protein OES35_02995, partial [Chromatiales bacterium]|nr:hypothetical protein [Chromatiales bacterium]